MQEKHEISTRTGTERNDPAAGSALPYPEDVARVLAHLAHLIDGSIALRGVGISNNVFAARHLCCEPSEIVTTTRNLGPLSFQLTGLAFADVFDTHPAAAVIGSDMEEAPEWERISLGDRSVSVPWDLSAAFEAGPVCERPIVVTFDVDYNERFRVCVWSRTEDKEVANAWLDRLIRNGRGIDNPFRGRFVRAWVPTRTDTVWFSVEKIAGTARDDLVLPTDVWDEVDRSVRAVFDRRELLASAGLSTNRGVLLAGPPGTGKTALCRALANELVGPVTVVFCEASVVHGSVSALYRELEYLSPALVVMEDLDLAIGQRRSSASSALNDFLLTLDGAMTTHSGVVTIATTNDPDGIDDAVRRAGRFDTIVDVDPPDVDARCAILRRYLRSLDHDVDVRLVANVTPDWTGAELRELVTRAVLRLEDGDAVVTTDILLAVAAELVTPDGPGHYL